MEKKYSKVFLWLELILMLGIIGFDILLPSVLVCVIAFIGLLLRKEKATVFGTQFWERPFSRVLKMGGLAILLSMLNYTIIIPILNHATQNTQNMTHFSDLKGNALFLAFLLIYSWVFAAFFEEVAYRGFLQHRMLTFFKDQRVGTVLAVVLTSLMFGWMHNEQGVVGIINTATDAVFFSMIRYHYKSVWASVLVHGFSNTIGLVAFYFMGPINGLW